jgi:hypothetical protein
MSDPTGPEKQGGQQINIKVSDDQKHGVYANFLVVSHSPHEFTLDFCQIITGKQNDVQAEIVSRVKVAPTMVGKIIQALNTNMTNYEDKFGLVKDVG